MKKIFLFLMLTISVTACKPNDDNIIDPLDKLFFQIEKSNSDHNFVTKFQEFVLKRKSSS